MDRFLQHFDEKKSQLVDFLERKIFRFQTLGVLSLKLAAKLMGVLL